MVSSRLLVCLEVLLLVSEVTAHSAYDSCRAPYDCPGSTRCRCNGPDGYQCRCEDGYTIDERRGGHECVKAAKLLQPCDHSTKCVPTRTFCNADSGQCECTPPQFRLSEDNSTCVTVGFRGNRESCNSDDECEILEVCNPTEKVCGCMAGLRLKTQEEYDAAPDVDSNCISVLFDLNSPEHCPATTTAFVPTTSTLSTTAVTTTSSSATAITTTQASEIKVYKSCADHSECPGNASCRARECGGDVCLCNEGFVTSPDNTTCVKKSLIGESCSMRSDCLPYLSYCDVTCKCPRFTRTTRGHRPLCTFSNLNFIGEYAVPGTRCQDSNASPAIDRTCQCKAGYRQKTDQEFWENRYDGVECVSTSTEECSTTSSTTETSETTTGTASTTTLVPTTTTAAAILPRSKSIGESCSDDMECPVEASCQERGCAGRICVCDNNHLPSGDRTSCNEARLIGESCTKSSDCLPSLSYCQGTCRCFWIMRKTKGDRALCTISSQYLLGEDPPSRYDCQDPNATPAIDGRCRCKAGYRGKTDAEFWSDPNDTVECVKVDFSLQACLQTGPKTLTTTTTPFSTVSPGKRLIMDPCTSEGECPLNSACQPRNCGEYVCACNVKFVSSPDRNSCIPGKLIGESCSEPRECLSTLSFCDGTCKCYSYALQTTRQSCVPRAFFFEKALNEACRSPLECVGTGTTCAGGRCRCGSGYREKNNEELWGNVTDTRECVPIDYTLGCPGE